VIKVGVGGAGGRMGRLIVQVLEEDPKTECVAKINRSNPLQSLSDPLDILIDFSTPDATINHLKLCIERGCPMVIGVTGFSLEQKKQIEQASKYIPIVFSPNMSIGINLCFKLLEQAAKALKGNEGNIDVAIQDVHHKQKKDAPSGTALRMGEIVANGLGTNLNTDIGFTSSRVGDVMGDHTVLFALEGERIEITHRSQSRMIYAKGAVQAAKWLMDKSLGLYTMQDIL